MSKLAHSNRATMDEIECRAETEPDENSLFVHVLPASDACEHVFRSWRAHDDGRGGEQICAKCGKGAMEYTMKVF